MLCYLNDDFFGGETDFYNKLTVEPKLVNWSFFPRSWQFPHRGIPVKKGSDKYILTTYLHYK